MPRNLFHTGRRKAGSITRIRVVGFSGTAVITWAVVVLTTRGKSNAGAPFGGISPRSERTVRRVTKNAGPNNVRPCSTGLTTPVASNYLFRQSKQFKTACSESVFPIETAAVVARKRISDHYALRRIE